MIKLIDEHGIGAETIRFNVNTEIRRSGRMVVPIFGCRIVISWTMDIFGVDLFPEHTNPLFKPIEDLEFYCRDSSG